MYNVRSSYHWLREREEVGMTSTSAIRVNWSRLWKIKIPPKMKVFFWKLLHNALAYNLNLQRRGVQVSSSCIRCAETEDLHHVFVGCDWATYFWFVSLLGFQPSFPNSAAFLYWLQDQLTSESEEVLQLLITTCWGVWMKLNDIIFNRRAISPPEAIASIFQILTDYRRVNAVEMPNQQIPSINLWKLPAPGHIKLNTDAGRLSSEQWRLGAVFRNEHGEILLDASKPLPGSFTPQLTEALGICWSLELAGFYGFT